MRRLFFIFISCLFMNHSFAGIVNENSRRWINVDESFLIDTKSFNIESPLMFFWIKNQNYEKRRLTINCSTFEERERYKQLKTEWGPILSTSPKYKILNQLCYLTDDTSFSKERRPPTWAENIIQNHQKGLMESKNLLKQSDLDNPLQDKKTSFIE